MADAEFLDAKAYLLKASDKSGINVYDHLAQVITKLLDERPDNAADLIESVSSQVKSNQFVDKSNTIQDRPQEHASVALAKSQAALFREEGEKGEDEEPVVPNVLQIASRFEECGVCVGKTESFRIALSLRKLVAKYPIEKLRFFGKIFGLEKSYLVVEAQYKDGEAPKGEEKEDDEPAAPEEEAAEGDVLDALPKSQFKAPPAVPEEEYGNGTNKKIYFVSTEVGEEWTLLPNVTPAQINAARLVKKYFAGHLDAPVVTYPPFPGNESNYLRAQIARIAAATLVSPIGFYTFDEENGDDEEGRHAFIPNEEFEPKTRAELLDNTLAGWVHHGQAILPQGRCKWVNPNPKKEGGDDEEEEEEGEDAVEAEVGPPLLHPLQNDDPIGGLPAWSTKLSSTLNPEFAWVLISSNRWPGAHAYALDREFDNIYIGWGHKFIVEPYSPAQPPAPADQFPVTEEITEAQDPTREEEIAFEASKAEEDNKEEGGSDEEGDE